jgi:hypothetical protein
MTVAPSAPVEHNWVDALRADGAERDEALAALHDLLLRAARFEIGRRRAALAHVRGEDIDDLAVQAADCLDRGRSGAGRRRGGGSLPARARVAAGALRPVGELGQ